MKTISYNLFTNCEQIVLKIKTKSDIIFTIKRCNMYTSTRKQLCKNEFECIAKGLSDDGGLFICDNFKDFVVKEEFKNYNYNELTYEILSFFFSNFNEDELNKIINSSYNKNNFNEKIVNIKSINDKLSFLELYLSLIHI